MKILLCLKLFFFRVFFPIRDPCNRDENDEYTNNGADDDGEIFYICVKKAITIQAFFEIFKLRNLRQAALLMGPEIVQQNGPMLPHRPNNVLCINNQ